MENSKNAKHVIGIDEFAAARTKRDEHQNAEQVSAIRNLLDGDSSEEMLQTLACYIGELDPKKKQVFASAWAEVLAEDEPL